MSELHDLCEATGLTEAQLRKLSVEEVCYLTWQCRWANQARPEQIPPESGWSELGYCDGRGAGKSRFGAEWIARAAWEDPDAHPSHVIAPTFSDIRFVCFEGVSGLLNVIPPELVQKYNSSDSILVLNNGAIIRGFSAEKPERLRGPQCSRIWADELAAWGATAEDCWDMAQFGLRLGTNPQIVWTSTPKPIEIVRKLTEPKPGRIIVRGSSYDNRANLSAKFFEQLEQYEGTTLGKQEIHGEIIDEESGGVIKRGWIKLWPHDKPIPKLNYVIMSLDTAFTEATTDRKNGADYSACTVIGVFDQDGVKNVLLLDCWAEQLGLPDLIAKVKHEKKTRYGEDEDEAVIKPLIGSAKMLTTGRAPDIILIESKGSGLSLQQMLAREDILTHGYNPGRADKLLRLNIVSPFFAKHRFWVPESTLKKGKPRNWCDPFMAQLCSFSGEGSIKSDDYVDAISQALRFLLDKGLVNLVEKDPLKKHDSKGREPPDHRPKRTGNPYSQ